MHQREIGKVISVDSFRIVIQLDDDLKSLYKSGYSDIYEIARINSYVILPVGADRIVAIITRVKIQDETEIEKTSGYISLPKAKRYLVATMIGTIENSKQYKQGVYNYPILNNPVWYVVKEDLDKIFDTAIDDRVNYEEDYFLPIGKAPAFSDYSIKINPDKFFGKHAAILGNTGSGKSCTVASLIQSLFRFEFNGDKRVTNANIIIFDTNGEYKNAFIGSEEITYKDKELVNAFHIDKDGLKIPYWFMNFADFEYLFEPSANTQVPILKKAIGISRNKTEIADLPYLDRFCEGGIIQLIDSMPDDIKRKTKHSDYGNWTYYEDNEIQQLGDAINDKDDDILKEIKRIVTELGNDISVDEQRGLLEQLDEKYKEYLSSKSETQISLEKNIDLPIWFNFEEFLQVDFDTAVDETENGGMRIRDFVSTLKLRIQSYYDDERIAKYLMLKQGVAFEYSLAKFLAYCLGDFCKLYNVNEDDIYSKYYKSKLDSEHINENKNQITIIDMSLLPYEVLETITGLIGRLILEFSSRMIEEERGKNPTVLILEEAQNYIPEYNKKDYPSISKRIFERIAREGRKYGLSLIVSSQRPSELSKTVLSQCNSFIIHRLQNPEDQKYIKQLVSSANEDILQQLPILPQQHAIVLGDAVRSPVQLKLNNASPRPNSDNPRFIQRWLADYDPDFPDYKKITEEWERGNAQESSLSDNEEEDDDDDFDF